MTGKQHGKEAEAPAPQVEVDFQALDEIIGDDPGGSKERLIMILQAVSKQYNFLPMPALKYISTKLDLPMTQLYEIATFYSMFSLEPRGRHIISICTGTACHVRGAERIRQSVEERLGIKAGETTEDFQFTLETVRCIGCCSLGPVVVIGEQYHGDMTSDKMNNVLNEMAE